MNLLDEAGLFLDEVRNTLLDALPLASAEDLESEAWLNPESNIVVGKFDAGTWTSSTCQWAANVSALRSRTSYIS